MLPPDHPTSQRVGPARSTHEPASAPVVALAIALLGVLLFRNHGTYDLVAVGLLVPLIGILVVLQFPAMRRRVIASESARAIVAAALVVEASTLVRGGFGLGLHLLRDGLLLPLGLPLAVILCAGLSGLLRHKAARGRLIAAIALVVATGFFTAWLVHDQPAPGIDVLMFQREGSAALLRGQNPYAVQMPNLYGWPTIYYAPELVDGDRLRFGYPYLPISLLSVMPSWLIAGDVRYAHVAGLTATLAILAFLRRGPWTLPACAMLALLPELPRVLVNGWIEPLMLPWLALTAWAMAARRPYTAAVAFGLFLATKQSLAIFVPLVWYVVPVGAVPRHAGKLILTSLATAAVVTLPFALWDVHAFWQSVVMCQVLQPFREDALTFTAWWQHQYGAAAISGRTAGILGFAVLVPGYALIALCGRRTPAGLGLAVALIGTLFFAFNKQAFLNYYVLVAGALAIALAHVPTEDTPRHPPTALITPD